MRWTYSRRTWRAVASSSASSSAASQPANNGGTTVGCVCNLPTSPDRCIASAFLPSARKESLGLGLSSKVNAGGSPTAFFADYICILHRVWCPPASFRAPGLQDAAGGRALGTRTGTGTGSQEQPDRKADLRGFFSAREGEIDASASFHLFGTRSRSRTSEMDTSTTGPLPSLTFTARWKPNCDTAWCSGLFTILFEIVVFCHGYPCPSTSGVPSGR